MEDLAIQSGATGFLGLKPASLLYSEGCCRALFEGNPTPPAYPDSAQEIATNESALRPGSSVVERGPEKAGVGGSIPSLATIYCVRLFV